MPETTRSRHAHRLRERLFEVIFEADTPAGKGFDVALLVLIVASVLAVLLESVEEFQVVYGTELRWLEWTITGLFTVEYLARLWVVRRPLRYARSFYGVVDLLSILPSYLSLVVAGTQSLLIIRALRLLRVFRILKMGHFVGEARVLRQALRASSRKITVFLATVVTLVLIIGAVMYLVEGPESGFTSIPQAMYWAIVTMTTVGYGDIAPQSLLGKLLASMVMITGYGIIAVPTGIVSVEMAHATRRAASARTCRACNLEGHDADARHCKHCGAAIDGAALPGVLP